MAEVKGNVEGSIHLSFIQFSAHLKQNFTLESASVTGKRVSPSSPSLISARQWRSVLDSRSRLGAALPSVYLHPLCLLCYSLRASFLEKIFFSSHCQKTLDTQYFFLIICCVHSPAHTRSIDVTRPIKQCQRWKKIGTMSGERQRRKAREWKLEWSCWINCCFIKDSLWWSKYDKMCRVGDGLGLCLMKEDQGDAIVMMSSEQFLLWRGNIGP